MTTTNDAEPGGQAQLLTLTGICKRYPGVVALDGVDFDLKAGEVHVVVGENGAGKSTLIKVIAGATSPDEGTVLFREAPITDRSVGQRKRMGIDIIYQELSLVPTLTIMENMFLGRELTTGVGIGREFRFRDRNRMYELCKDVLKRLKIDLEPRTRISSLTVAQKQLIEIARAVAFEASVIVMDEPTTSLGPNEKARLFEVIADLKARKIGIIYVSHILEDCVALGDRITVLRDGRYITTRQRGEVSPGDLVPLITGRSFDERYPTVQSRSDRRTVLEVEGLSGPAFRDVSFVLHEGEILGFAGLVGAGRTDVMRAIAGLDPVEKGTVRVNGRPLRSGRPGAALKAGVAILTEDRKVQGVLRNLDVQRTSSQQPSILHARRRRGA